MNILIIEDEYSLADAISEILKKDMDFGLPIAKGIIEKYKGSIYTISNNGFTSFIIKF